MNVDNDKIMDKSVAEHILHNMILIRTFEQKLADLARISEFQCPVHLTIGQEAIAAGVCENLHATDYCFGTHRSHGHYLAKGGDINALMAEILGRDFGCSRGFGGSMHITCPEVGFMGTSAIVAGTIPLAVGAALATKQDNDNRVSVVFFGDGATDEGVFYESMNFAILRGLPILFVCENNTFSTHMPDFLRQSNPIICERIRGFGIPVERVDGNLPLEIYNKSKQILQNIRNGGGPVFLECMTYRWMAHVGPDVDEDIGYRRKEDIEHWRNRCPIAWLIHHFQLEYRTGHDFAARLYDNARVRVDTALEYAYAAPRPESLSCKNAE